jgi:hypothetical protein
MHSLFNIAVSKNSPSVQQKPKTKIALFATKNNKAHNCKTYSQENEAPKRTCFSHFYGF